MTDDTDVKLDRFRAAADNFIQTVDSVVTIECESFLALLSHRLAELYSAALDLPPVEPDTTSTDQAPLDTEKWTKLSASIRSKIGSLDTYWRVFDSTENKPPVQSTLAGDISEIYFDLLHDLRANEELPRNDFLWEVAFFFSVPLGQAPFGRLSCNSRSACRVIRASMEGLRGYYVSRTSVCSALHDLPPSPVAS